MAKRKRVFGESHMREQRLEIEKKLPEVFNKAVLAPTGETKVTIINNQKRTGVVDRRLKAVSKLSPLPLTLPLPPSWLCRCRK
jgi:S-adenosylmethionine:diacylglycerol 3-amino-3-carboxypropyl transferase